MLDERKTAILSAVVQEYIATAQPVGSTHVADAPGVRVSPATVRNEMAVLEQEGYLVQPHTSAGRVPTDKGYRFFVDHLTAPGRLDQRTTATVGEFFATAHGRLEEMLHRTTACSPGSPTTPASSSGPTAEAVSGAVGPAGRLSSTAATVVAVLGNGAVESETIELAADARPTTRSPRAGAPPRTPTCVGSAARAAWPTPPSTGDDAVDRSCAAGARRARQRGSPTSTCTSAGRRAMASAFDAVDIVRDVLRTLEQQFVVVSLVSDILDRGMSVAIGAEHGVQPLVGLLGGRGARRRRRRAPRHRSACSARPG